MPSEKLDLRISLSRLLTGLILIIVPLSVVGLYVTLQSDHSLEKTIGTHFKTIAESVGGEASQLIHDRVIAVGVMAGEPTILEAIAASNRSYQNVPEASVGARFEKMESSWNSPASDAFVKELLSARASALLRRHHDIDPRFLKITVTDERGATVAATHKPVKYVQAGTEHWRAVYAEGKGGVNLTEIAYDEQTKSNYIGIGVPVQDEGSGRFLGSIHALVDVSDLFLLFSRVQIGPTGRALLVKEDGTVISGPDVNLSMNLKSEEYAAVREAMGTLTGRQTGYVVAGMRSGNRALVGFADTGLKQDYRNLGWVVVVAQDEQEATSPLRGVGQFALWMVFLAILMVTLLTVYFFLHRREQVEVIESLAPRTESRV
jgi:hypothetical protein